MGIRAHPHPCRQAAGGLVSPLTPGLPEREHKMPGSLTDGYAVGSGDSLAHVHVRSGNGSYAAVPAGASSCAAVHWRTPSYVLVRSVCSDLGWCATSAGSLTLHGAALGAGSWYNAPQSESKLGNGAMKRFLVTSLVGAMMLTGCVRVPERIDVDLNTGGDERGTDSGGCAGGSSGRSD